MTNALALPTEQSVEATLKHRYFLRMHMTFILAATFAAGLATTKLLLMVHVNHLGVRYAIAVCAGFAVFLGFVRLWLAYVGFLALRRSVDIDGDGINVSFGGGGSGGGGASVPRFAGGGGSGGGGGATESWGASVAQASGKGGGGVGSKLDLDFGDDAGLLILIILLVLALVIATAYVIYAAPAILSEAAFNAALTGALVRRAKHATHGSWEGSVVKATALPFLAVLILATATGWYAHKHCPSATRLREAMHCVTPR